MTSINNFVDCGRKPKSDSKFDGKPIEIRVQRKASAYRYEDGNDDDSVFSASSFFVAVVEVFIPVDQM